MDFTSLWIKLGAMVVGDINKNDRNLFCEKIGW